MHKNRLGKFPKIQGKWEKSKLSDHDQFKISIMRVKTKKSLKYMSRLQFGSAKEHDLYGEKK